MDAQNREIDSWEKAIEKAIIAEAKALLQSFSSTCKIDSKCLQGNRPAKKEEKDFGKTKSTNTSFTDVFSSKHQHFSAHQSQTGKKDQN